MWALDGVVGLHMKGMIADTPFAISRLGEGSSLSSEAPEYQKKKKNKTTTGNMVSIGSLIFCVLGICRILKY